MAKIKISHTSIEGLMVIEPEVFGDDRGFFMETYHKEEFFKHGLTMEFVQDNHSRSKRGVLRGLHLQTQYAQGKLVRVIRGSVWDVAVDLREGSPTFGQWEGILLSAENKKMFYIPKGFAHGFLTLEDETEFVYKCTDYYHPEYEAGVRYDDPEIGIQWPFDEYRLRSEDLILSAKDAKLPTLAKYLQMTGVKA